LCGNAHLLDWISQDKTYKEWFDSSEVSILNVHGSSGTSSAAEYIFQRFEERRAAKPAKFTIAYFTFHQHDNRRNSVLHMLNTLLSQIFNHKHDFADLMDPWSDEMRIHRSWTQGDLFLMFCQLLSRWDHNVLCVINGLDKCDNSRSACVKDLCTFASISEHHFKIAITSNSNSDLQATLTNWPTINLDNQPAGLGSMKTRLATDISHEVQDVVLHRPELGSFDNIITERLSLCGKDKRWRRILQNQLKLGKSSTSRLATRQQLENLPSTLHGIFANILASVPADRRTWARKAISWISNAILPLKIWELTFALAFDVDNPPEEISDIDELLYQGTASDLEDYFGGMFVVENNEVYIGHPDVKEFFLAANGEEENVWYDVKETAHQDITDVCHAYLSSQEVKDLITSIFLNPNYDLQDNSTNSTPRMLFSSYAVEFWPTHYSLIPETRRPTKRALEFVQNKKTLRCWAELYWVKSNTVTRTNRSFLSLLPLFAGLGLQDLVNQWLELETEGPEASKDHALALTEAARNGHAEVVVKLLELGGYNKDNLQDTLITSVGLCNEVVLSKLIDYVVGNLENFDWPPAVLCRAAQYGLEDVVRKLLQGGASLENATTVQNMTPLHLASRGGHEGVVKVLMEYKANITAVCLRGRTPLLSASVCGHSAIVTLLLDAGADVNFRDTEDNDALLLTCIKGYHKTVEILSNAGCNVGYKKTGWSPLVIVCDQGFFKCAQLLLKNKLDLEIEGFSDWTPLRYAAVEGHRRLCELLLKNGANVDSSRGGAPIIKECATLGAFELVKLLVEHGATIDAVDTDGFTALTTAAIRGDTRIVTFLLDHGANINHEIGSGHTALLLAAQEGFAELVQILIDRGADMERKSTKEWGALHLSYDHAESARVLLENKADVNKLVGYYSTLHLSTEYNYVEAVKVLLSFNPDLEITFDEEGANKGFTALLYGTAGGNCEIVRLLLEAGANVNHQTENNNFALQYALKDSNEAMVRALMEYNPDLNLVDNDGDTALNCLNSSTSVAVVKLLVNGGLDIDIANKEGSTPLSKAVATQNVEVIKYLIAKKAKVNIMGGPSGGPLHNACALANLELVKILVAAGADVNLVVPSGLGTPLQSACVCNDPADTDSQETVVRYLINEAKADVTTVGGKFGCAINTACGWSTSDMVKLMLEKGAKVDVADSLGRMAVHYAAKEGLEYFQPVLDAGADVEVKDKMGRTLLHWAVAGGLVDVVERVLSLSRRLLDQPDVDGWTPLLWAVKKQCDRRVPAPSNSQEEIVKLLLDRGADPCVVGKGIDREWSAVKIARYQGADDSIVQLLIAKAQEKIATLGEGKTWDEEFNESKRAQEQSHFCDSCFAVSIINSAIHSEYMLTWKFTDGIWYLLQVRDMLGLRLMF
jgi:ankyrin repeat protein